MDIRSLLAAAGINPDGVIAVGGGSDKTAEMIEAEMTYFQDYVLAAYQGDDRDAVVVREFVKIVQHWFSFIRKFSSEGNTDQGNSKATVHAILPTQEEMGKAIDELMNLATVRMLALGIEPPENPLEKMVQEADEEKLRKFTGGGFVPPMSNAG